MEVIHCNECGDIFADNVDSAHCPSCGMNDHTKELTGFEEFDDAHLEILWELFGDIPMNPETECMEEIFLCFPAGTFREDIWHWFDEKHSRGVAYLMGV